MRLAQVPGISYSLNMSEDVDFETHIEAFEMYVSMLAFNAHMLDKHPDYKARGLEHWNLDAQLDDEDIAILGDILRKYPYKVKMAWVRLFVEPRHRLNA